MDLQEAEAEDADQECLLPCWESEPADDRDRKDKDDDVREYVEQALK